MRLVVVVLGRCRFDILLAVSLFAVAVSPNFSEPRVLDSHQFVGVWGLAAERTGTMRETDRSREGSWAEELGNTLGCLLPLA